MATRRFGAHVRPVLRGAGAFCGRVCRRQTERSGHVRQQRHQGGGLFDDALWHPPFAGLCHRGLRRCGLLACKIRHLDGIVTRLATGQSQWLD